MALNFLMSAASNLNGYDIGDPEMTKFCSFNGFMIQTFVDQSKYSFLFSFIYMALLANCLVADYWVLSIAVCTFIMVDDKKSVSQWLQNNKLIVWAVPWFLSLLWATLGLVLAGYGDIGACMSSK